MNFVFSLLAVVDDKKYDKLEGGYKGPGYGVDAVKHLRIMTGRKSKDGKAPENSNTADAYYRNYGI